SMHYGNDQPYLPWYNTIVWLAVATPLPTLVLGVIGLWHCIGTRVRTRREAVSPSIWVSRLSWLPEPGSFALILPRVTLMVGRARRRRVGLAQLTHGVGRPRRVFGGRGLQSRTASRLGSAADRDHRSALGDPVHVVCAPEPA